MKINLSQNEIKYILEGLEEIAGLRHEIAISRSRFMDVVEECNNEEDEIWNLYHKIRNV